MRLVLAFLFVVATVGFASAQGTSQGTSQGTAKRPPQAAPKAAPQAAPQAAPKEPPNEKEELLRQRMLLKERFNKGYDVQIENAQDPTRIPGRCKAEARKRFSVLHPMKRRKFTRDCIERKGR